MSSDTTTGHEAGTPGGLQLTLHQAAAIISGVAMGAMKLPEDKERADAFADWLGEISLNLETLAVDLANIDHPLTDKELEA